jgi:hypothetical protein
MASTAHALLIEQNTGEHTLQPLAATKTKEPSTHAQMDPVVLPLTDTTSTAIIQD